MEKIDFLAETHGFRFNGYKTAKTWLGGLLTIVFAAGAVAIVAFQFVLFENRSTPNIFETVQAAKNYPNTTLDNMRLFPIIRMRNDTQKMLADEIYKVITPAIIRVTSTYTLDQNGTYSLNRSEKAFPYKPCADLIHNDTYEYGHTLKGHFSEGQIKLMLCPEYVPEESYVLNKSERVLRTKKDNLSNWDEPMNNTVIQFVMKPCSLDFDSCVNNTSEDYKILRDYKVSLISQRIDRQFDNLTHPIKLSYEEYELIALIEPKYTNYYNQALKTVNIWDNRGFPYSTNLRQSLPTQGEMSDLDWKVWPEYDLEKSSCPGLDVNGGVDFLQCNTYFILEMYIDELEINITRTYKSLADTLTNISGLVNVLKVVLAVVYMLFHNATLNSLLVKSVFKFLPPKPKKKKRICCRKRKESSDDKYADGQPKIERHIENKIEYLRVTQEIYDQALEKIMEHVDMVTLIRELFNLKLLVNALMKNYNKHAAPLVILSNSVMEKNRLAAEKKSKGIKGNSQNQTKTEGIYGVDTEEPNELLRLGNGLVKHNRLTQTSPSCDPRTPGEINESKLISEEVDIENIREDYLTLNQVCTVLNIKSLAREREQTLATDEAEPHDILRGHQNYRDAIDQYCLDSLMSLKSDLGIKELDPAELDKYPKYATANTKIKELAINSPIYGRPYIKEE